VQAEIKKRLIPKWCADENSFEAVALAVQRTSFIVPPNYLAAEGGNSGPSALLDELVRFAKLDANFFDV
jgi:hypothetical protein